MKRFFFLVIIGVLVYAYYFNQATQKKVQTNNYKLWLECLERSDYSDLECEKCDKLYNINFYSTFK